MSTSDVAELERAISAAPDDEALRRVLADALEERGDPRAEHIVLAFAAERDRDAFLRLRAMDEAASARLTAFSRHIPQHVVRLRWRLGLVERIDVEGGGDADLDGLAALIAAPECCALRALDLRGARCDGLVDRLDGWLARRPIRWLGIADRHAGAVEIAALLERHPRVDGLGVVAESPNTLIAALADLRLRELDFTVADSQVGWLPQLVAERWPLTRLVVEGFLFAHHVEPLEPVLRGEVFPALTAFGAMGAMPFTTELLRRLARAPLFDRLTALGLRASTASYGEPGQWLRERRERLAGVALFTSGASLGGHDESRRHAEVCALLGRREQACQALDDFIAHGTAGASRARIDLADHRLALGETTEALASVDAALADERLAAPDRARAWRTRAQVCARLGRDREVIEACNASLDLEPDYTWTYQFLGTTLRKTDQRAAALDAFAKGVRCAIELDHQRSQLGHARMLYGNMLWSVRRRDEAIVELVEATRSPSLSATRQAEVYLGWMAHQRGDLVEARVRLERVVDAGAEDVLDGLAGVRFDQGDLDGAFAAWRRAGDADSQGHVLIALGRAAEVLELATDEVPGSARACALHALGRVDEAIAALDDPGPSAARPCMYRRAAGWLLHGLWARDAKLLERALPAEVSPVDAYVAAMRELPDAACTAGQCGRKLVTAGAIAALALGRGDDARARANAVVEQIAQLYASETLSPMWEVRAAIAQLPEDDRAFARRLVRAAEQCVPEL